MRVNVTVMVAANESLLHDLSIGRLELAVARIPEAGEGAEFKTEPLTTDTACVVASANHPLAGKKDVRLADLSDQSWVLPRSGTALARQIEAMAADPVALNNAAARALSVGRPHAARDLADLAERVGGGLSPVAVGPVLSPRVKTAPVNGVPA